MSEIRHGGALDKAIAEYGGTRADWLDLSTGINPVPYLLPEIPMDAWHCLPDKGHVQDCLDAAREYYGVPEGAAIVAAPGTQAIIQKLPYLIPAQTVSIQGATYAEYVRVFREAGWREREHVSLKSPLHADANTRICVSPDNPTGIITTHADILRVAAECDRHGGFLVVDEAFADMVDDASAIGAGGFPGLIVLKSFGKFFGLAGVRLGFAIGDDKLITRLENLLGPWAVPGPALAVGAKALRDVAWVRETRERITRDEERLQGILSDAWLTIIGGTGLFTLASHVDPRWLAGELARRCILVRTFDRNPSWIRFGLPADDAGFQRLEQALAEIVDSKRRLAAKS